MTETTASPPSTGPLARIFRPFREHPVLSSCLSVMIFALGAVASSVIGDFVERRLNSDAIAQAEIQQQQITEGTQRIEQRVTDMQAALQALGSGSDVEAFQREAERLLQDLAEVTPVIQKAALTNADFVARLRQDALSRPDGATTTAALELTENGSATICRDFTVGLSPRSSDRVTLRLARKGQIDVSSDAQSGDTVSLRQSDASASATIAGLGRGASGTLIGIDYNCFEGKPEG